MTQHNTDERREFLRIDHEKVINYQEINRGSLSRKNEILAKNVSASGILFRSDNLPPALSSILKIDLDEKMLGICKEIESDLIIKDGSILGRVVRIAEGDPGVSYDIGICFLRRKELTDAEISHIVSELEGK